VTLTAQAAAKGGRYQAISGAERTCSMHPAEIGRAVRELSQFCVPRGGTTKGLHGNAGVAQPPAGSNPDDVPVPFGYKSAWVALRCSESHAVANALKLEQVAACSWTNGIKNAYDLKGVFVAPAIAGWTLCVGSHPDAEQSAFVPYMEALSAQFGEAFYFSTHRFVGYHAWARAANGIVSRAFAYLGERGEFLIDTGNRTPEEIELETGVADLDLSPDEETVLELAGKWVLDPREIDLHTQAAGPGLFGIR
jgi:hypothetical protein